jgi:hypothetical protein
LKPSSSLLMAPSWIYSEGVSQGASTACSVFWILDRSDWLMFHPELQSCR